MDQAGISAKQALGEFWQFARERDADLVPHARSLGLVAAFFGLLVGIVAARFTMIVSTSLLGTLLVGSGVTGLLSGFSPGFYRGVASHPQIATAALGMCFVISLILQTRLTGAAGSRASKSANPD